MNIIDAAHRVVHDYPGGSASLGPRVGIGQVVLNSKVNPNTATHHLSLEEAVRISCITGRADILHAFADRMDHVAVPRPVVGDDDLSRSIAKTCAEFGDYMRQVDSALHDGQVTPNELKGLERELTQLIAQASHLQSLLAGMSVRVVEVP